VDKETSIADLRRDTRAVVKKEEEEEEEGKVLSCDRKRGAR